MAINKSTLITKLRSAVNDYIYGSTSTEDVLSQSLSVWLSGEVNIVTVNTADDLPILEVYDSTDAILCFLLNLGIFAISSNKKWLTLDGRLLRDDTGRFYSESWAWGANSAGQLGDNTTISRSSPVRVVGGFTDWLEISGTSHTIGVRNNGTIWTWGCNFRGQLGDDSTINRSSPVSVVGGFTDWCQVSAGSCHNLGVRTGGTAWAWGAASNGELGNASTISRSSPVSVVGGFTDWCQVSAGSCHNLGVRTGGTAWAWGSNGNGRLGINITAASQTSPVIVSGGFTDWCQVSAGYAHNLGIRTNGTAWGWGINNRGQLGDNTGSPLSRSSPVSVSGGFTDWCQVSAGNDHSLGLRTNGTLWAWGCNGYGRLGDNTTINRSSPVSVVGGFTDWCQLSAGGSRSLGVRTNGTVWAWGANFQGLLGDNSAISRSSPVSIVGGITNWSRVGTGIGQSFGITRK
jgi:alpha-tubulin suppressor-like RCC1 family protein